MGFLSKEDSQSVFRSSERIDKRAPAKRLAVSASVRFQITTLFMEDTLPRSTSHHGSVLIAVWVVELSVNFPDVLPSSARSALPSKSVLLCVALPALEIFSSLEKTWTSPRERILLSPGNSIRTNLPLVDFESIPIKVAVRLVKTKLPSPMAAPPFGNAASGMLLI